MKIAQGVDVPGHPIDFSAQELCMSAQQSENEDQRQPTADNHNHHRFKHEHRALTLENMASRMRCTPEVVLEREVADELFSARAPHRGGGPRYPVFQLNKNLNKPLWRRIIKAYRDADVSTSRLWIFLRSPQFFSLASAQWKCFWDVHSLNTRL